MDSFSNYPTTAMAASNNEEDFALFPFADHPTYPQFYTPTTSYDTYAALNAGAMNQLQHLSFNTLQHTKAQFTSQSPIYSPANSASTSFDHHPPVLSSNSDSGTSGQSTISSTMGSPSMSGTAAMEWHQLHQGPASNVALSSTDGLETDSTSLAFEKLAGCVDPSLIDPYAAPPFAHTRYSNMSASHSPQTLYMHQASPTQPHSPFQSNTRPQGPIRTSSHQSQHYQPYPTHHPARRLSVSSARSQVSRNSQSSLDSSEENKGICPIPSCRRHIKDLKAHMLTHQNERPEKCPIPSCEYHHKGFARKYDKNRHTLTHYKGTMVCDFCPGRGSASEKSFNRADVFKRHLTSVHNVEQTAPNARRKSPTASKRGYAVRQASGVCSTCSNTFPNAQEFYEHLDDCVLRVVQRADPCEAINEKLLTSVAQDAAVMRTLERHNLNASLDYSGPTAFDDDDGEEEDVDALYTSHGGRPGIARMKKESHSSPFQSTRPEGSFEVGNIDINEQLSKLRRGLTYSKHGVSLKGTATAGKGNKRRRNYPLSWGAAADKMRMKKRVLCVYDGQRRLWKDDMMLDADHEVRIPLPGGDGRSYITDLDVQTLRRAEGLHGSTEEERGPWLDDDGNEIEIDIEQLMG